MSNTYTQLHVQFVFAVKHRYGLIQKDWKEELFKYITGIVQNNGHKMIIINGMPDHVHILVGLRPNQSVSEIIKDIKQFSSKWINEKKLVKGKFEWQEGFGAFSYSKKELCRVISYIENQELHHQKKGFLEEYRELLIIHEINYQEEYLFKECT